MERLQGRTVDIGHVHAGHVSSQGGGERSDVKGHLANLQRTGAVRSYEAGQVDGIWRTHRK